MEPVTLRTERLVLSAPTADDIDAIFAACQDELIQRYTTVPVPYERQHAEGFVEKTASWWDSGDETVWVVRAGAALAGMVGLHKLGTGSGELGYWMAPPFRGGGLLTEAARAVIEWGLHPDALALQRIEWRAVTGNIASARAARTLGFRYEGTLRAAVRNGAGTRSDAWIAGLLPDDERVPQPWPVLAD